MVGSSPQGGAPLRGDPPDRVPDAFVRRTVTAVGILILGVGLAAIVVLAANVLLLTFAGVLLGIFLLALRDGLARHTPLSPGWALGVVLVVLVGLFGAFGVLAAPQIADQFGELGERLPEIAGEVEAFLQEHAWGRQLLEMRPEEGALEGAVAGAAGFFGGLLQSLVYLLAMLFIGVYVAIHPDLYANGLVRMMPLSRRRRTREVLGEIDHILRWFLVARALAMVFVGVSTAIALTLLDVPLALLLAFVAGMLTFIPYLGPIIAAIPIVLVALTEGPDRALLTLLVYTAIEQVEGNVFEPLVLKRIIHLPPVVTVVSQLLGGALLGLPGIALATPAAAVGQVLVKRVYREDVLGEPQEEEREEEGGDGGR
jgi:predicted PurR-regulated permease PerM